MLRNGSIQYSELILASRMIDFACKKGLEALHPPRILHTHLPLRMLPKQVLDKKIKCVQILRNPKDVCVSFFNHAKRVAPPETYQGNFHEFTDAFFTEQMPYGRYDDYLLSWKADVSRFPDLPFLCFFYEDMKVHPLKCVKELRAFLGLNITDAFCEAVVEACSFDKLKMKERTGMKDGAVVSIWKEGSGGTFYRKGEVGDWKNWFTVAESENFDITWNEKMNGSGIEFSYSVR
ncbi:sulfotransferase 1A3-like [Haliotis rubra]|uniref:sulfotransferase 1A3-like n=1 Tax=Haliotis rubra TaxID=36100 RepID=UPI001EE51025|nr:sulfotransferase 1A3-like [Haliotis rubra]